MLSENTPETRLESAISRPFFGLEQDGQILVRLNDSLEVAKVPASIQSALPSDPRGLQAPFLRDEEMP